MPQELRKLENVAANAVCDEYSLRFGASSHLD
jgi:hypothetical protein